MHHAVLAQELRAFAVQMLANGSAHMLLIAIKEPRQPLLGQDGNDEAFAGDTPKKRTVTVTGRFGRPGVPVPALLRVEPQACSTGSFFALGFGFQPAGLGARRASRRRLVISAVQITASSVSPRRSALARSCLTSRTCGSFATRSADQLVLPVGIITTLTKGDVFNWGQIMTGALLGAAPPLIIYAFLMDYYIAGLTAGATKG